MNPEKIKKRIRKLENRINNLKLPSKNTFFVIIEKLYTNLLGQDPYKIP